jgi:pimeloyl-ACP methyl ester carboxylesterase
MMPGPAPWTTPAWQPTEPAKDRFRLNGTNRNLRSPLPLGGSAVARGLDAPRRAIEKGPVTNHVVATSSFVRVDEVDLHWAELGSGPPLVLLHGLCDSHRTWFPVAPTLARSRRVLMIDLAGHGESSRPDASYTLEWHANIVGRWLERLGLGEVDLVGHSFGGGVAQWMLLEHRKRIRRLGLESAGGLGREVSRALRWASFPFFVERFGQPFMSFGTIRALDAAGAAFTEEEIAMLAKYNARPGTARAFSRSVRDVIDWRGQRRHFLDRAREVPTLPPIAIFWGESDKLVPIAHGIDAAALMCASLTRFPGVGHFPHRQEPARYAAELEGFLGARHVPNARLLVPSPHDEPVSARSSDAIETRSR